MPNRKWRHRSLNSSQRLRKQRENSTDFPKCKAYVPVLGWGKWSTTEFWYTVSPSNLFLSNPSTMPAKVTWWYLLSLWLSMSNHSPGKLQSTVQTQPHTKRNRVHSAQNVFFLCLRKVRGGRMLLGKCCPDSQYYIRRTHCLQQSVQLLKQVSVANSNSKGKEKYAWKDQWELAA